MDLAAIFAVEILYAIASLVVISAGLAVVFGMMRVINLAHGEFMMVGGYATIVAVKAGINIYVAMLIVAPIVVGILGVIVERLIIRRLYGRLVDTMLATWGLSLLLIGLASMIFGNTTTGISPPIAGFAIGRYQVNGYSFFIILARDRHSGRDAGGSGRNALRPRRPRRDAERVDGLGARLQPRTGLHAHLLCRLRSCRTCRRPVRTASRPGADDRRRLHRQGLHHRHFRRRVRHRRPAFERGTVRRVVPDIHPGGYAPMVGEIALLIIAMVLLRLMPQGITSRFFRGRM